MPGAPPSLRAEPAGANWGDNRAEHARRSRRIGIFRRVERIGTPAARCRRRRLDRLCARRAGRSDARSAAGAELLKPEFVIVRQPFERRLKLLIAVLHLLDLTGELTNLILQAIDPDQKVRGTDLREPRAVGLAMTQQANAMAAKAIRFFIVRIIDEGGEGGFGTIAEAASKLWLRWINPRWRGPHAS